MEFSDTAPTSTQTCRDRHGLNLHVQQLLWTLNTYSLPKAEAILSRLFVILACNLSRGWIGEVFGEADEHPTTGSTNIQMLFRSHLWHAVSIVLPICCRQLPVRMSHHSSRLRTTRHIDRFTNSIIVCFGIWRILQSCITVRQLLWLCSCRLCNGRDKLF